MILNNCSEFFSLKNCKYSNEQYKRNCARLSLFREFNLLDSYTIESSCYGFELKGMM